MNICDIYTTISDIKRELEIRNNDPVLKKKVADFLGTNFPLANSSEPYAVITRSIISPNMEFHYFVDLLEDLQLKPLLMEYPAGKFVSKNKEKYFLCRPTFFEGLNVKMESIHSSIKLVDFNKWEGKPMEFVSTYNNSFLIDAHRNLLKECFPEYVSKNTILNISEWFNNTRFKTDYYYLYFLAMFIHHGVLLENFMLDDSEEKKFSNEKLMPSIKKAEEIFGVRPLIYPLLPTEHEKSDFWYMYKKEHKEKIKSMLKSK